MIVEVIRFPLGFGVGLVDLLACNELETNFEEFAICPAFDGDHPCLARIASISAGTTDALVSFR